MTIVHENKTVEIPLEWAGSKVTSLTVPVETFRLEGIEGEFEHSEDFLFGCDYATAIATTDRSKVDYLMSLITDVCYQDMYDDSDSPGIAVYNLGGVYLLTVDPSFVPEEANEKIENEFVMFGAEIDDIDIPMCLIGYRHFQDKGLTVGEFMETDEDGFMIYKADEDDGVVYASEDEFEDTDDLECGIDFLQRVFEMHESPEQHKEIIRIFEKLDKVL
jgi:hypothetical protein